MKTKVIEIYLPGYNLKKKPDYLKIGRRVDKILESFPNGKYVIRAIGSQDHPNYTISKLINLILRAGTDRYDSKKKAVAHKEFCEFDYDIHAGTFEIVNRKLLPSKERKVDSVFGDIVLNFYENAPKDRGYAVKIDLLLIYDRKKLRKAKLVKPNIKRDRTRWDKYLYTFKDQNNKKDALLGIIKIISKKK